MTTPHSVGAKFKALWEDDKWILLPEDHVLDRYYKATKKGRKLPDVGAQCSSDSKLIAIPHIWRFKQASTPFLGDIAQEEDVDDTNHVEFRASVIRLRILFRVLSIHDRNDMTEKAPFGKSSLDKEAQDKIETSNQRAGKTASLYSTSSETDADVDVGYGFFLQAERERIGDVDEKEWNVRSKIVLRKIDFHVLPIICIVYCLQTRAQFMGLQYLLLRVTLRSSQYANHTNTRNRYLVSQYPLAWLIQRLPIGRFLVTLMTTAACTNFAGAMINRFVLGCLEAAVTPSFVLMTGMWYTAAEQPFRQLTWYSFQAWANTIGGLIGYGVGHIKGGLQQWTYIYLILGGVTALFSIVVYFFLPDSPVKARFFTGEEKVVAVKRVASNKTGIDNTKYGVFSFANDRSWYSVGFHTRNITAFGGLRSVKGKEYTDTDYDSLKIGNVTCIIAAACMAYLPLENHWGRLVAFWFTALQRVRQCSLDIALGILLAPFSFIKIKRPDNVIKTAAGLCLGAYMYWENRRREHIQQTSGPPYDEHEGQRLSLLDKTEFVRPPVVDMMG
ncbi:hypothetical protein Clacol_006038 [Clathrus columnatus]|uniref:Uncharacterized protein n=1 Tax=Clathrus columnatus TaxID=1419009 RepID=A0AAV5AIM4_9AGAM|nr:hypothetical protein Clacol_006038 [Clathrus columnatus]